MEDDWKVVTYKKRKPRLTRNVPQSDVKPGSMMGGSMMSGRTGGFGGFGGSGGSMMDMDQVVFRRPDQHKNKFVQPTEKVLHDRRVEEQAKVGDLHMEVFPREFVIKVQAHRVKLHRDQKWLAQHLNVPVGTITQLELGRLPYDPKLKSQLQTFLAS